MRTAFPSVSAPRPPVTLTPRPVRAPLALQCRPAETLSSRQPQTPSLSSPPAAWNSRPLSLSGTCRHCPGGFKCCSARTGTLSGATFQTLSFQWRCAASAALSRPAERRFRSISASFRGAWRGLGSCPFPALLPCPFVVCQPCSTSGRNASTLKAWEVAPVQEWFCAGRVLQQQGGDT